MHKITKGLKKKKKGKKSKNKEDELFKPEELEAYRRGHQQPAPVVEETKPASSTAGTENDEWKKFNALTAGIDSFLKKTQDDLDRIKTTSFFQRIPTASQVKQAEEETNATLEESLKAKELEEEQSAALETGIVVVSESESEEEDEDIFDTSYLDVIAAGDVKLAYIPESPTDELQGDDPFDTSIAERAILGPVAERKGKKLVPLGAAVEVLTGRVQAPTCVPIKRPSTRRTAYKQRDLLLGSFDDNANAITNNVKSISPPQAKPSLLDDDAPLPLPDEPIDLSQTLHQIAPSQPPPATADNQSKNIVTEFDVIASNVEDEDDIEFALLAAESLTKAPAVNILPTQVKAETVKETWNAFDDKNGTSVLNSVKDIELEEDPFDTTFAENILPGKQELKIIENEILSTENDVDFNPRTEETLTRLIKSRVSIQITDPAGEEEFVSLLDRLSESELNTIQPQHRDLLGGSITDLTNLGDQPLKPKEQLDENYIEYCDPFDTTIVDTITAPGQAELKFLESELLSDIKKEFIQSPSDEDFDPRAEEPPEDFKDFRKQSTASVKSVSFTLPLSQSGLLDAEEEDSRRVGKPLTPYYTKKNSLVETFANEDDIEEDPFDTSFVSGVAPGKAELKLIESELFNSETQLQHSLSDSDFNPRDEKQVAVAKVVQTIKGIADPTKTNKPTSLPFEETKQIDLLEIDNKVNTKVLTPAAEKSTDFSNISYVDPFDTSIASNILPGKAELRLLETELIQSTTTSIKRNLTDPDFDPRDAPPDQTTLVDQTSHELPDLLAHSIDAVSAKPLTPVPTRVSFDIGEDDNYTDPFDTSIANNLAPGRTELKLLESELV